MSAIVKSAMKAIIAALLNLLLVLPALGASPVWEVRSGDAIIYLAGSCHVLRESDFPLPGAFDRAYGRSAEVVFETDIGELQGPEFQRKVMAALMHHDGRSLAEDLSPEAWRKLKEFGEKEGIQVSALNAMKPPLAVLTLLSVELQKLGVTRSGVDQLYYARARADGKKVEGLETADEQIDFLALMGEGMEDELIEETLADLRRTGEIFEALVEAWKGGNAKELNRLLLEPARKDYPGIYRVLFAARNAKWLPRIETLLATPETELVVVGAGHLVGPDGLIEGLRKKGYELRQLD